MGREVGLQLVKDPLIRARRAHAQLPRRKHLRSRRPHRRHQGGRRQLTMLLRHNNRPLVGQAVVRDAARLEQKEDIRPRQGMRSVSWYAVHRRAAREEEDLLQQSRPNGVAERPQGLLEKARRPRRPPLRLLSDGLNDGFPRHHRRLVGLLAVGADRL